MSEVTSKDVARLKRLNLVLVAMPWCSLFNPSIQLGVLVETARSAGFSATTCHYNLSFADFLAQRAKAEGRKFGVQDYMEIGVGHMMVGLGEWIFSVPPFRTADKAGDEHYLDGLRRRGSAAPLLDLSRWIREQVPDFLAICLEDILQLDALAVGFTTGFNQTIPSLVLAQLLKQRAPDTYLIFGGADCESDMGEGLIRAFDWIDAVVQGEGEPVLPELLADIARYGLPQSQPGLCLRQGDAIQIYPRASGGRVGMDDIQIPDYSDYFTRLTNHALARDISPAIELPVESSRGCWWGQKQHCTFCGFNGQEMRFRSKSPERLLSEMSQLAVRHKVLRFLMTDAILDHAFFKNVIPSLADTKLDFQVFYEIKSNLNREQVEMLRCAGIVHVQPGIESLDSVILASMRKGTTALLNVRLLKYCFELGINTLWNIIYGFPHEEEVAYHRMADLARSLTHLQPPSLVPLVLDRFSPYERDPCAFGLQKLSPPEYYSVVFPDRLSVREQLMNISYRFEYRHLDGRDPEAYVGSLRERVRQWQQAFQPQRAALRHVRGPEFLTIFDERVGLPHGQYVLQDWQAEAYLACDAGATASQVARQIAEQHGTAPKLAEVASLLDELCEQRLMFQEAGRYLSLSIPARRRYPFVLLEA